MKKFWIAVVIIILVVLGMRAFGKGQGPSVATPESTVASDAVTASDQAASNTVVVDFASFTQGGYVEIHEASAGKPGKIIGSSPYLPAGEQSNVEVQLSRTTKAGETLFAMLHSDDGDQKFNGKTDVPITDAEGNIVLTPFTIEGELMEKDDAMMEK